MEENIFYLCIHKRAKGRADRYTKEISIKDFHELLAELYHLPSPKLREIIIKQMEQRKLIEVNGKFKGRIIKVIQLEKDFEKEVDKIYKKAMFF